jgi:Prokaryotic dksA/traR C4-type zinc finger
LIAFELLCRCGWRTVCGWGDVISRLRLIGALRRETEPSDDLLEALFLDGAQRMTCPLCKEIGLRAAPASGDDETEDGDWQTAVLCEICRQPIAAERLEALPDVRRCVACQGKAEAAGGDVEEPEFCPNCGSLVELRVSKGAGITRYRRFCTGSPPCRL